MRRGLVGVGLLAAMLLLALVSVTAWAWPENYPSPGGWRGGPKEGREEPAESE